MHEWDAWLYPVHSDYTSIKPINPDEFSFPCDLFSVTLLMWRTFARVFLFHCSSYHLRCQLEGSSQISRLYCFDSYPKIVSCCHTSSTADERFTQDCSNGFILLEYFCHALVFMPHHCKLNIKWRSLQYQGLIQRFAKLLSIIDVSRSCLRVQIYRLQMWTQFLHLIILWQRQGGASRPTFVDSAALSGPI